jgi:hypothetical protein
MGTVAGAGKDGKAGILGEGGIGFRELAEKKYRAPIRRNLAGVGARGAETDRVGSGAFGFQIHVNEHTQKQPPEEKRKLKNKWRLGRC